LTKGANLFYLCRWAVVHEFRKGVWTELCGLINNIPIIERRLNEFGPCAGYNDVFAACFYAPTQFLMELAH